MKRHMFADTQVGGTALSLQITDLTEVSVRIARLMAQEAGSSCVAK
jgi:hypothetical protein